MFEVFSWFVKIYFDHPRPPIPLTPHSPHPQFPLLPKLKMRKLKFKVFFCYWKSFGDLIFYNTPLWGDERGGGRELSSPKVKKKISKGQFLDAIGLRGIL